MALLTSRKTLGEGRPVEADVRYAVVTAVRDEAANLPRLGMCLISQTVQPTQWIIVDTGSTDESTQIARQLSSLVGWIVLTEVPGQARATRGGPVVDALHHGLARLTDSCEYVLKIDADVSFDRDHAQRLLMHFSRDPCLGIASGTRHEQRRGRWRGQRATASTVDAQLRAYRRDCLEELVPLERRMGWDVLDESRAIHKGWRTKRVTDLAFRHHRAIGARDRSRRAAWSAQGDIAHYSGYRPSYLIIRSLYRSIRDPAALFMLYGFAKAKLRCSPHAADRAAIDVRRSQQRVRDLPARATEMLQLTPFPERKCGRADLLLATNAGGHLLELISLDPVFQPYSRQWVTQDTDDAHEFLADERVLYIGAAGTRSVIHLARNLLSAIRVIPRVRPRVAISTGSAIAVPFLWIARLFGSRVVFIECGGRVQGRSISHRLLTPVADRVYVQWETSPPVNRARFAGKALLARTASLKALFDESTFGEQAEVLVAVGTCNYPFERLLLAVEEAVGPNARVIAQCGVSHYRPAGALCVDFLPPSALSKCMRSSRVVVCHAGIGLVSLARAAGRTPIVVPRLQSLGEHVDDHQVQFARELHALGLATLVEGQSQLGDALHGTIDSNPPLGQIVLPDLASDLSEYLSRVLSSQRDPQDPRRRTLRQQPATTLNLDI